MRKRVASSLDGYHAKDGWGSASDWPHAVAKASFHCFYQGSRDGKEMPRRWCLHGWHCCGTWYENGRHMLFEYSIPGCCLCGKQGGLAEEVCLWRQTVRREKASCFPEAETTVTHETYKRKH